MSGLVFWFACLISAPHAEVPEPHVEEPHAEVPHVEEPHVEEPHVEEPHVEEPHVEEPHVEEPHVEEPHVEEPHGEVPHVDKPHTVPHDAHGDPVVEPEPPTPDPPAAEPEEVSTPDPLQDANPRRALRGATFTVILGFVMVLVVGLLASALARRRPHLRPEIATSRFLVTVVLLGWTALTAAGSVQAGGLVASLGSLVTIVVLATGFGMWWVPRYLDGLWVVLSANHRRHVDIECNGVRGTLKDVGALRATLVDSVGHTTSVPITSFGGAVVREGSSGRVQLEVPIAGDFESARIRATVSPFRDPSEPVRIERKSKVLKVRCWNEAAATLLEEELLGSA